MRIATFTKDGETCVGIVDGDAILDLAAAYRAAARTDVPYSVLNIIQGGAERLSEVRSIVSASKANGGASDLLRRLEDVKLSSPIPAPTKNVFCVGRNYKLHIEEGARARGTAPVYPKVPEFFTKPPTAVIGHDDAIRLDPSVTEKLDYEVELAIVIGKTCRDVPASRAADVVFGYTVLNDVTARDLQFSHGQWFKGKGLDTYCPIGPWIVTADEFGDPSGHQLSLSVNGELRQSSSTDDMLFDCFAIIESLSAGMTLEAGDIISTGTPSGVALGMSPQIWLRDGDIVEAEISAIGSLRNVVRATAGAEVDRRRSLPVSG